MLGQTSTMIPTAIPSRLDKISQPRSPPASAVNEKPSPTTPVASAYAPKRIVRAKRLMPGQRRITTPSAIESRPFKPSAHLIVVSCVSAILETRVNMDSIGLPPGLGIGRLDYRCVAMLRNRRDDGSRAGTPQPV